MTFEVCCIVYDENIPRFSYADTTTRCKIIMMCL